MVVTVRRVVIAAVISVITYPLSYAPLDRLIVGPDHNNWPKPSLLSQPWRRVYAPLSLVSDQPLAHPVFQAWSRLWGVEMRHTLEAVVRAEAGGVFASDPQRQNFYGKMTNWGILPGGTP